jgi:dTMP kinase
MSFFITFEGGEGCGKSTQARALHRKLEKLAIPSLLIHEPGGTALGEKIRHLLKKSTEIPISSLTELILFNASRSQLVSEVILPGLTAGQIVICDRFSDSTLAYQSYARGLNIETVRNINRLASQGLVPDLTFLLDVSPVVGLARKKEGANDRFEKEKLDFHQKVRQGFLSLAAQEPQRWVVIDSTFSRENIASAIWQKVSQRLKIG